MSKVTKLFGAALIAGAATLVTQSEPVESYVDTVISDATQSFRNATQLNTDATTAASYGLAGILALLGIGAIAGSTRRKLEKEQHIGPAVQAQLEALNDQVAEAIKNSNSALEGVDSRVEKELKNHMQALSAASSEMTSVEDRSARVLEILEKIENSANAHIALNTPEGVMEEFELKKRAYDITFANFNNKLEEAATSGSAQFRKWPEFVAELYAAGATLNENVQEEKRKADNIFDGSSIFMTEIRQTMDSMSQKFESNTFFGQINARAGQLAKAAGDYVAASKMLQNTQSIKAPSQQKPSISQDVSQFQGAVLGNENFPLVDEDGMIEVEGHGQMYVGLN